MNWKEINEKCPKAFLEWAKKELTLSGDATSAKFDSIVDTNESEYWFRDNTDYYFIVDTDEARILPFYFDQFGIFVEPYIYDDRRPSKGWKAIVSYNEGDYYIINSHSNGHLPDRLSATIAGVTKAFEIREAQLNELKQ